MTKFTPAQQQLLEDFVSFTKDGNGIKDVACNITGDVKGSIGGSVWGSVRGSVSGSVFGNVGGSVWGNKTERMEEAK
jgi:outer membrane lipoprotein SlyB